ncbi:MAG: hypothetical protein PVSMB1_18330 [Gemmatimonadaceae bacterium]
MGRGRPAILNRDDRSYERLRGRITGLITSYGCTPGADIWVSDVRSNGFGTACRVHWSGGATETVVPLRGSYNVSNALAAAGLALSAGFDLNDIAASMPLVSPPPGRMQRVDAGQPFDVLVDYAHTSNAFRTVLTTLHESASHGRLIAVFGAAGDRDHSKRPEFARIARDYADYFIITNEDPFGEQPDAIMDEVAAGIDPRLQGKQFEREPDRGAAIERAIGLARPGDTVIILGKGHEQNIVVNGHKEPWSDSRAAHEALQKLR